MRKRLWISILSVAVALVVPLTALAANAETFAAPSEEKTVNGIVYKKFEYTDGGKQVLFYGEYNPAAKDDYEFVIHNVRGTDGKAARTSVSDIAADYERSTGKKVMLATNGDYFDLTSGQNMESLVIEGVVYTIGSFASKHCLGFDNKGNTVVGRMTETEKFVEISSAAGPVYYEIDKINQAPADGEVAVYTSASGVTVEDACKYKVRTDDPNVLQFPTSGTATRMSEGTVTDDKSLTLASGEFALVVKGENEISRFLYDTIAYGTEIRLVQKPAGAFKNMRYVVGGYDILVNDGVVNTNCHTDNDGNGNAPRTFLGVKEDGTMFLGVLDGRQAGYSVGCTVDKEAQTAKQLGAKYALELDGGGSSVFLFDFNDGKGLTLCNRPSDGRERKVSNAVLLVEKEKETPPPDDSTSESTGGTGTGGEENSQSGKNSGKTKKGCGSVIGGAWLFAAGTFTLYLVGKKKNGGNL